MLFRLLHMLNIVLKVVFNDHDISIEQRIVTRVLFRDVEDGIQV